MSSQLIAKKPPLLIPKGMAWCSVLLNFIPFFYCSPLICPVLFVQSPDSLQFWWCLLTLCHWHILPAYSSFGSLLKVNPCSILSSFPFTSLPLIPVLKPWHATEVRLAVLQSPRSLLCSFVKYQYFIPSSPVTWDQPRLVPCSNITWQFFLNYG